MRSDNSESRKDISADELLALLHKSVEKQPSKKSGGKDIRQSRPNTTDSSELKIADEVYDDAKRGLMPEGDDDVDIEALISKFIRAPEKKPEPENEDTIVREVSRSDKPELEAETAEVEEPSEAVELEDDDVKVFEPKNDISADAVDDIEASLEEADFNDIEPMPEEREDFVSESYASEDTAPEGFEDDEPSGIVESSEDFGSDEPISDGRTAVFDIARVKELSSDEEKPSEVGLVSTELAATEVFEKIHPEDNQGADEAPRIYGQPEADEIDQTDLNLMIAFGMNDELKDKVGEEKASEIEADLEKKNEETIQIQSIGSYYEYTDRAQNTEILTRFRSEYYWGIGRIALAAIMFIALFWVENCSIFGKSLPTFMSPESYPVVYAMIDLQFIVICGALVWRQIVTGLKNMIKLEPTPECLTAFMMIMSVAGTIISCFIAPRSGYSLYNLPTAAAVLLALIYEFMNLKRSVFGFNVISSKRKKLVVSPVSDATESLEREVFGEYVPADARIIRVAKTDFVDGFFAKTECKGLTRPVIGILIPSVLVVAAAFFFIAYFRTQSLYTSFSLAFQTVTAVTPLSAFIIYSLPYYLASKRAYDNDSAVIGDAAFGDFADPSVISFEDKEVFPNGGVKVTSIKVYGNNRIDEIIYNLASAFTKVGGPLAEVFGKASHDLGHSENVEIEEVEEDGFTVTVDDISVSLGKASYIERQDFEPPYDPEDKRIEAASIGILYVAYQGELAAKVYVQYTIDGEFEKILSQLYKTGMCVGIKSFDPNIDDMLLAKKLGAIKYPVKVIRSKTVEDIPHTTPRCESGVVSKRSVKELLRTVASCERASSAIRTSFIFKILAMLLGIVIMVFVLFFDAEPYIRSIYAVIYQLIWIVLVTLVARFTV